jgi:hypothetical protein
VGTAFGGDGRGRKWVLEANELELEAIPHADDVTIAVATRGSVHKRVNVIQRKSGVWIEMPIQPERQVCLLAALDSAGTQVDL